LTYQKTTDKDMGKEQQSRSTGITPKYRNAQLEKRLTILST